MSNSIPVTFAIGTEANINKPENIINEGQISLARDSGKLFIDGKDKRFKIASVNMEEGQGTNAIQQFPQNNGNYENESWPIETDDQSINQNIIINPNIEKNEDKNRIKIGAFGDYSVSLNSASQATGKRATAQGSCTVALGAYSHAEGNDTISAGPASHAEGITTSALGEYSHVEGSGSTASGHAAHAENHYTKAEGQGSHTEGGGSEAYGEYSHAGGYYTIAGSNYQTAIGKFNIRDNNNDYAFIIGNGDDNDSRSNAFTVDWDGKISANELISQNVYTSNNNNAKVNGFSIKLYYKDGTVENKSRLLAQSWHSGNNYGLTLCPKYDNSEGEESFISNLGDRSNRWNNIYTKKIYLLNNEQLGSQMNSIINFDLLPNIKQALNDFDMKMFCLINYKIISNNDEANSYNHLSLIELKPTAENFWSGNSNIPTPGYGYAIPIMTSSIMVMVDTDENICQILYSNTDYENANYLIDEMTSVSLYCASF